ncbi:hypothetical protein MC7420_5563 [Coleofasciculus chthonoplastes PCC 7420]|uniref:Uncharacterized protein n=1 Tax=Coleofasciculus chthonoplastes PCC 7420 TaxID=118168 RepID=B4VPF0_9CYAN|nr:hypothetical protein MC7420_5563 [Coleofasciculus chthonoplastes PCC 7420]
MTTILTFHPKKPGFLTDVLRYIQGFGDPKIYIFSAICFKFVGAGLGTFVCLLMITFVQNPP